MQRILTVRFLWRFKQLLQEEKMCDMISWYFHSEKNTKVVPLS